MAVGGLRENERDKGKNEICLLSLTVKRAEAMIDISEETGGRL